MRRFFNFLFTAVDDTLTPAQEAYLDMSCYPWSPSIWELSNLLSQKRKVHSPAGMSCT